MNKVFFAIIIILASSFSSLLGDTFVHTQTGEKINGYSTSKTVNGKSEVKTGGESLMLNMAEYTVTKNTLGRNNIVSVISIDGGISMEIETKAFETALVEEADKGPLFILIEIDTPGGRIDLAKRLCSAITKLKRCQTVAFIKGGENGGAYSAGVAVSLSCNKIYMSPETVIGAATVVTRTRSGKTVALSKVYDEDVAEKASSAWRNYLSSMAQQNGRPGLLTKAMVDKEYEVIEVTENGKRSFVELSEKTSEQKKVKTWSKKGELLTLPAADAIECGMADKLIDSRPELLADMGAATAEVVTNKSIAQAVTNGKRLNLRIKKMKASLDLRWKKVEHINTRRKMLKEMRGLIAAYKKFIKLNKQYPDVGIDEENLEENLNNIKAYYDSIR